MRRSELTRAIYSVQQAMNSSGASHLMRTPRNERKGIDEKILNAYAELIACWSKFGPAEIAVAKAFRIEAIKNASFWQSLFSGELGPTYYAVRMGISTLDELGQNIANLLSRESDTETLEFESINELISAKKITLIIREPSDPSITLKQLSQVIISIERIYDVISRLDELSDPVLVVGSLDSGSDKSIDLIGAAKGIATLSSCLVQCWEKYRFAKQANFSASVKSMNDGIDVLERIRAACESKVLSSEEAEKMRRDVLSGVHELFESGVYTPEMNSINPVKPAEIPFERKKLLTHSDQQLTSSNFLDADDELSEPTS